MDLNPSAEDELFRQRVRRWFTENRPSGPVDTLEEQRGWHRKMYDAGFIGMGWPAEYGGHEASLTARAIVVEEMALMNVPPGIKAMGIQLVGPTIIHHGTDGQKQRFLRPMLTGEQIWCQLYSEPNAGSDLASLRCLAEIDGDVFVVNGQKIWTSGAYNAEWGILLARTDRHAPKHQGISCILVPMDTPGIDIRPLKQITGTSEFCEVFFTNVRVSREHLIGEMNAGWQVAQTTLGYERAGEMLAMSGRLTWQFGRALEVVDTMRQQGCPAIEDAGVRQRLGQVAIDIAVLRYSAMRARSHAVKGNRPGPEASIAKLHYSELDKSVQETLLDILGPYGQQVGDVPAGLALSPDGAGGRDGFGGNWGYRFLFSRAGTIYSGSSEIQKNVIGERVLGLPKEIRADRLAASQGTGD